MAGFIVCGFLGLACFLIPSATLRNALGSILGAIYLSAVFALIGRLLSRQSVAIVCSVAVFTFALVEFESGRLASQDVREILHGALGTIVAVAAQRLWALAAVSLRKRRDGPLLS